MRVWRLIAIVIPNELKFLQNFIRSTLLNPKRKHFIVWWQNAYRIDSYIGLVYLIFFLSWSPTALISVAYVSQRLKKRVENINQINE